MSPGFPESMRKLHEPCGATCPTLAHPVSSTSGGLRLVSQQRSRLKGGCSHDRLPHAAVTGQIPKTDKYPIIQERADWGGLAVRSRGRAARATRFFVTLPTVS